MDMKDTKDTKDMKWYEEKTNEGDFVEARKCEQVELKPIIYISIFNCPIDYLAYSVPCVYGQCGGR
jgi:hypothetical protein